MIVRHIASTLLAALADTPVVFLNGARQAGKSTLAQHIALSAYPARYVTLDDATTLAAARHDPTGFIRSLDSPAVLDEVQRVPDLFLAIKTEVDRNPHPGRFLLTGSADVLLLPRISESLAGRMEILTLWPFSQGEISGVKQNFPDEIFRRAIPGRSYPSEDRTSLQKKICSGGYPALLNRSSETRRNAWLGSYITAILQRDVRDISNVEDLGALPRLLALLAARSGSLMNFADLSRNLQMPQSTLKRYFTLLETTYLTRLLPAWCANVGKRTVKSPKFYLNDTGLMAYLSGINEERLATEPMAMGRLLENFVFMELVKQIGWSETRPRLFHFRLPAGSEVDFALETPSGQLIGIEVKASATAGEADFRGLRMLAEIAGNRFRRGIVLYTGRESVSFGAQFHAVPVSALWALHGPPN